MCILLFEVVVFSGVYEMGLLRIVLSRVRFIFCFVRKVIVFECLKYVVVIRVFFVFVVVFFFRLRL